MNKFRCGLGVLGERICFPLRGDREAKHAFADRLTPHLIGAGYGSISEGDILREERERRVSKVKEHKPVKLIVGMFTNRLGLFQEALRVLEKRFGPVDYESPLPPFNKTDYYEEEFGKDLKRKFYSFKRLIKAEDLPKIKIFTNNLEKKFSEKGNRLINLDPGYLTSAKLVLATTKDYQHRIYYGKGIYGEVTLRYKRGSFIPWEWTYPDYRTKEYIEIFNHIRKIYMEQLRQ